jgi:gamma-glutamylcyclotransferase (GGCT)/AIG2-like uncharacterized protein YtfP
VRPELNVGNASPTRHVFVYGTLVEPNRLDTVLGHKHPGERLSARLTDYQRVSDASYPYLYVLPTPGAWVDGVLLMDLTPYDMQLLDRYEEVESGVYRREAVEVEAWGCGPRPIYVQADVYAAGHQLLASVLNS